MHHVRGVKQMHQILIQWLSRRQLYSEPELYCVHRKDEVEQQNIYKRAQEHNEEQQETSNFRNTAPQMYVQGNIQCMLSVHVDDIKGTARKDTTGSWLKHPSEKVGQYTADCDNFHHTGIRRWIFFRGCVYTPVCLHW